MSDEIEQLRVETKDLNVKAQEAGAKSQDAWNQSAHYEHVVESLKLNKEKQEWLQKNLEDLSQGLKKRDESDEWLQTELDQYEQRMLLHEEHKEQLSGGYDDLKHRIEQVRESQHRNHVEAGKYEEQKANHERQVERRAKLVKETARSHSIRGYESDLNDLKIREYMEKISKLQNDHNISVDRARQETIREMKKTQDSLSKLGEQRSAYHESKINLKQQSTSNDRKIRSCQMELNAIEMDEGGKAIIEANIEDLQSRLEQSQADIKLASWDDKLQEKNSQLRLIDDQAEKLNSELIRGTKQAGDLARFDHLKVEMKNTQRKLDTMSGAHDERLKAVIGEQWHISSLETEFQHITENQIQEVKTAESQRDDVIRKLEQVEYQLKIHRAELTKAEDEINSCTRKIRQTIQGDPSEYPQRLSDLQNERDTLKADVDNYTNDRKIFSKAIKYVEKHGKCKMCLRQFHAIQERREFIENMEKMITKSTKEGLQKELIECEAELQEAKMAGQSHDNWIRLSESELPRLQTELNELEDNRRTLLHELEEHDKKVTDQEQAKRDVESLAKPIANILKYSNEISSLNNQLQELAAKQKGTSLSSSLEEIQDELKSIRENSRTIRECISKMTADREQARSQSSSLELDLTKAKNDLVTANHELEKSANIFKQIESLKQCNREHRETVNKLEEQIQDLTSEITKEETKLDDIRQRRNDKENNLQHEATMLSNSVNKLKMAEQNIQAYIDSGGSAELIRCQRDIENAEKDIVHLSAEQTQVVKEINKISELLRNHQETKRTIVENIKYRRSLKELESVKMEIEKLSAQNAIADWEHHKKQATYWQNQHRLLSTAETSKMGTMKAKDDQLMQLLDDWNTDYKDAASKYKESHIKVEVRCPRDLFDPSAEPIHIDHKSRSGRPRTIWGCAR